MNKKLLYLFIFFVHFEFLAAQTVGVFHNDSTAFNGYTLFFPNVSKNTWLLDNCGNVVQRWESDFNPGLVAYLLENGDLLRTARIGSTFNGGGSGGRIERYNWEGDLIWGYNHSSADFHQHHDIEYLPNGNILVIAWERYTTEEAIEMGRSPFTISNSGLWAEQIVELQPIGDSDAEIVWEWHLWDHLVQDFDANKPNFGVIAEHPELLNLNAGGGSIDWVHFNSIDYNPVLDQIIVGSRHLNEVYIIDHSTTTAEAASHQGGNANKGGDFLYRWGNPEIYDRGTPNDQLLYGQHDAYWIEEGQIDEGKIMIFNNGVGRPSGNYSTVDVWETPVDAAGNYFIDEGMPYGPNDFSWRFGENPNFLIYSSNISGAQRLPNGNTLICEGRSGELSEVDYEGNEVWRYVSPVVSQGFVTQGNPVSNNSVFRAYRYGVDYPAFEGRDLTPGEPLELAPTNQDCQIFPEPVSAASTPLVLNTIKIVNNPIGEQLVIENASKEAVLFEITDLLGHIVDDGKIDSSVYFHNTEHLATGIYIVRFFNESKTGFLTKKIIKQ